MITKSQIQKLVKLFTTFSTHLSIFLIANAILWAAWVFLFKRSFDFKSWPLYFSAIWLAVLIVHFLFAYYKFRVRKDD
jgi:lysylphosphatidylglycerol synthetase-like protein (DUF2156 family)